MKRHPVIMILFLFGISFIHNASQAQQGKNWPSCMDYKLQGKVKSWTMKNDKGIVRKQEFNIHGELTKDTYQGTEQTHTNPEALPEKLRETYEKVYDDHSIQNNRIDKMTFNKRMQLVERKSPGLHETNTFTEQGKIQVHKTTQVITTTRAWNSTHHAEPTYTFTDTMRFIAVYKYNQAGLLVDFQYFHSDPFQNVRMIYIYDSANHLVETNRYDNYNIFTSSMPDHYLNRFFNKKIDADFEITDYDPDYWKQGSPVKQTWQYNAQGQKTEYVAYGYMKGPSFMATWEYDENGNLLHEIHHDVYHNTIRSKIDFDAKGNVIKEIDYDYWAKKEYMFTYEIEYY